MRRPPSFLCKCTYLFSHLKHPRTLSRRLLILFLCCKCFLVGVPIVTTSCCLETVMLVLLVTIAVAHRAHLSRRLIIIYCLTRSGGQVRCLSASPMFTFAHAKIHTNLYNGSPQRGEEWCKSGPGNGECDCVLFVIVVGEYVRSFMCIWSTRFTEYLFLRRALFNYKLHRLKINFWVWIVFRIFQYLTIFCLTFICKVGEGSKVIHIIVHNK